MEVLAMGRGLGKVQIAILQALSEWPDLDYGQLCRLLWGEDFTESNRANVRRAIRVLEAQGRVRTYFWGASVQCVRLASPGFREPEFPEPHALAEAARHPLLPKAQAESSSLTLP